MVTQVEIARRAGLDVSSSNKILNRRKGPSFRKETVHKVFRVARQLGYDFGCLKHEHRRRHSRKVVNIRVELLIYRSDGSVYDEGTAVVRDISLCGVSISDVCLPHGTWPVGPFTVGIRPLRAPLRDVELRGRIVRFYPRGRSYAIDFDPSDAGTEKKVRKLGGI